MGGNNLLAKNMVLLALVVALVFSPMVFQREAAYEGADGQAEEIITELRPDYEPWFQNIWEPPSGEVESFLFALQAALGSGFVFYYIGYIRGRKKEQEDRMNNV